MSFEDKVTWVSGVVTLIVVLWYAQVVGGLYGQVAVEEIAYQRPLLFAIGAMIVLTVVGSIAMSIATAIGVEIEISGEGSVDDIGALRFAAGEMTQARLADRVGLTRQTIIVIEQGRYSPSLEVAFKVARVSGVPLDRVFAYPEAEP